MKNQYPYRTTNMKAKKMKNHIIPYFNIVKKNLIQIMKFIKNQI